jgi:hypothetical protein
MKEYFAFKAREQSGNEYWDVEEDIDCVPCEIIAGTLHVIDAETRTEALAKLGVDVKEIVFRIFEDIDFCGELFAKEHWLGGDN